MWLVTRALLPLSDLPAHRQFLGGELIFLWKYLKTSCQRDHPHPATVCCKPCFSWYVHTWPHEHMIFVASLSQRGKTWKFKHPLRLMGSRQLPAVRKSPSVSSYASVVVVMLVIRQILWQSQCSQQGVKKHWAVHLTYLFMPAYGERRIIVRVKAFCLNSNFLPESRNKDFSRASYVLNTMLRTLHISIFIIEK